MKQPEEENHENPDHVIDIPEGGDVSLTGSSSQNPLNDVPSNDRATAAQSSSSSSSGSNPERQPSVYKALICIKLTYKMSLIISSVFVLVLSRHEKPQNPLFTWVVVHTIGCVASVPITFRHWFLANPRLWRLANTFTWTLELFFAFWFIVGNYWIFTEKNSAEAHDLYRLCVMLLVFSYIKYVGPFFLCTMILCCCSRALLNQTGGAPDESIEALPTYKFKLQKIISGNGSDTNDVVCEGVAVASGTERERVLMRDDAFCCICLSCYDDNEELKELPCCHFFHAGCVDTWLKIKGFCPLCKCRIGKNIEESPSTANPYQQV